MAPARPDPEQARAKHDGLGPGRVAKPRRRQRITTQASRSCDRFGDPRPCHGSSLTRRSLKPTAYRLDSFRGASPRRTKTYGLSEVRRTLMRSVPRVNPSRAENSPLGSIFITYGTARERRRKAKSPSPAAAEEHSSRQIGMRTIKFNTIEQLSVFSITLEHQVIQSAT